MKEGWRGREEGGLGKGGKHTQWGVVGREPTREHTATDPQELFL